MDILFIICTLALVIGMLGLIEFLERLERKDPWT